jgi:hypothetical protein
MFISLNINGQFLDIFKDKKQTKNVKKSSKVFAQITQISLLSTQNNALCCAPFSSE